MIVDDNTAITMPKHLIELKKYLKDYEYMFWDKQSIQDLMRSNNDYDCLDAFDKLKPYALKADLARYYIVNKFGGWYSDINNFQKTKFPDTENIDMIVFRERLFHTNTSWAVVCGYFYSKPNNPILTHVIDSIIYNTQNNFYGKNPLYPTGPSLFGRSIACESFYNNISIEYGDFIDDETCKYFKFKNRNLAVYKPNNLKSGELGHPGSNSYVSMWFDNDIYEKENK